MKRYGKPWAFYSRFFFLIVFIGQLTLLSASDYHYTWTPALKLAFEDIQQLRLDDAQLSLQLEKQNQPKNLVIPYLEDYIFFYTFFITEDKAGFEEAKELKEIRLDLLAKGPKDNPEYAQFRAEVLIHWALVRAKFESYFLAAQEINKAFKMLKKNEKHFPNHMPTRRMLATLRAGVGTLPKKYKWIVKLLSSLEGSVQAGVNELMSVVEYSNQHPDFIYRDESRMLYALVLTHFAANQEAAYQVIHQGDFMHELTPLKRFAITNMAQASGKNDEVIELIEGYQLDDGSLPILYMNYMLGIAKLYRNDSDADIPLLYFVNHFKGQHYIKEAYQKLAWHALINQNRDGYERFIQYALTEGNAIVDEDKQAYLEAEDKLVPHPILLQARLLFDGGYYEKAKLVLSKTTNENLSFVEQMEYDYRLGRIYQELGVYAQALGAFQKTILKGEKSPYYFACNAALQSGLIYEQLDMRDRARDFFYRCLAMAPDTYQNSLHQKAKTGLNRLKSKKKS